MSACEHALGIEHIVSSILYHFSNLEIIVLDPARSITEMSRRSPSLLSCMLVNKLWADEATKLIWSRKVTLEKLCQVEPARRQYYSRNVRTISTVASSSIESQTHHLDDLAWPRLRKIISSHQLPNRTQEFTTLGTIGTQTFRMKSVLPDRNEEVLVNLQQTWSSADEEKEQTLTSFRLTPSDQTDETSWANSEAVILFLQKNPSIDRIAITCPRLTKDAQLLEYLASRPGLKKLEITLDPCAKYSGQLCFSSYSSLEVLDLTGPIDDLQLLLGNIPNLRIVRATLTGTLGVSASQSRIDTLFESFSRTRHLESFQLRTKIWSMLSNTQLTIKPTSLIKLAQACPRLEAIDIDLSNGPDCSALTNQDLNQISAALPALETLHLPMKPWLSNLTGQGLVELGLRCRHLSSLHIGAAVDIQSVDAPEVVFPRLRSLVLGMPAQGMAAYTGRIDLCPYILSRHFPRLETVCLPEGVRDQDTLRLCPDGKHGFLSIEPLSTWNGRSIGTWGPGCNVAIARTSFGRPPNLAGNV